MKKNFICEICHCETPFECEGSEPNTCADCMPLDFEFIRHCKARNNAGLTICQPKKKNLAKGLKWA